MKSEIKKETKEETFEELLITKCINVINSCTTQDHLYHAREYTFLASKRIKKQSVNKFLDTTLALRRRKINCHHV